MELLMKTLTILGIAFVTWTLIGQPIFKWLMKKIWIPAFYKAVEEEALKMMQEQMEKPHLGFYMFHALARRDGYDEAVMIIKEARDICDCEGEDQELIEKLTKLATTPNKHMGSA